MIRRVSILLACVLCLNIVARPAAVSAGNLSGAADAGYFGLDISSGAVYGDGCEFTMRIPAEWLEYVVVAREPLPPRSRTVEQLNLYFRPKNAGLEILANIFVFETKYSAEVGSYKRILETDEYDFRAYVSASEPEFTNAGDRIMYNHIIGLLGDLNYVAELFSFPDGRGPIVKERLYVNGALTEGSVIYKSSRPYVPLRAACEALGYTVIWYGADASVYIERQDREFTLYTAGRQNYGAERVENSFYVPALFFIQLLRTSFETDKRGNVFITERDAHDAVR